MKEFVDEPLVLAYYRVLGSLTPAEFGWLQDRLLTDTTKLDLRSAPACLRLVQEELWKEPMLALPPRTAEEAIENEQVIEEQKRAMREERRVESAKGIRLLEAELEKRGIHLKPITGQAPTTTSTPACSSPEEIER